MRIGLGYYIKVSIRFLLFIIHVLGVNEGDIKKLLPKFSKFNYFLKFSKYIKEVQRMYIYNYSNCPLKHRRFCTERNPKSMTLQFNGT